MVQIPDFLLLLSKKKPPLKQWLMNRFSGFFIALAIWCKSALISNIPYYKNFSIIFVGENLSNQLKNEKSPYLKQHENNPVDWLAWNKTSLEKAKIQKKPIFLSVGYASCHWCHVMAHESFENLDTAKIMNEKFINIKVDRE